MSVSERQGGTRAAVRFSFHSFIELVLSLVCVQGGTRDKVKALRSEFALCLLSTGNMVYNSPLNAVKWVGHSRNMTDSGTGLRRREGAWWSYKHQIGVNR